VRLYATGHDAGLGTVVFFHGGGWVLSSVDGHDSLARMLAARSGALVVSVDYRLAPEHPYPAPHDDCWAVTAWLAAHGTSWGADPRRLVVAGDSAGANLAAGVALRARDEGLALRQQTLMYPCVDTDLDRPSYVENAEGYFLTTKSMAWFWDQYTQPGQRDDPYAVPMRASDLRGVAPALVQTAEFDPLRDEGEAFAARLAAAGVDVTVTRYPGVVHGFVSRWGTMARGRAAHDEIVAAWARALGDGALGPVALTTTP
jgi:acetyl esterase